MLPTLQWRQLGLQSQILYYDKISNLKDFEYLEPSKSILVEACMKLDRGSTGTLWGANVPILLVVIIFPTISPRFAQPEATKFYKVGNKKIWDVWQGTHFLTSSEVEVQFGLLPTKVGTSTWSLQKATMLFCEPMSMSPWIVSRDYVSAELKNLKKYQKT